MDSVAAVVVDAVQAESAIAGKRSRTASFKQRVPSCDGTLCYFVSNGLNSLRTPGINQTTRRHPSHRYFPFAEPLEWERGREEYHEPD